MECINTIPSLVLRRPTFWVLNLDIPHLSALLPCLLIFLLLTMCTLIALEFQVSLFFIVFQFTGPGLAFFFMLLVHLRWALIFFSSFTNPLTSLTILLNMLYKVCFLNQLSISLLLSRNCWAQEKTNDWFLDRCGDSLPPTKPFSPSFACIYPVTNPLLPCLPLT